jgi:hypothetical protein
MTDLLLLVSNISIAFIILVALFCLFVYNKKETKALKYLFNYIFLLALIEIGALIIGSYFRENNLPLLHILTLGEFILLSLFYRKIIAKPIFKSKGFLIFIAFISLLIIGNSIFLQEIYIYNSYAKSLVQAIVLIYAILYFYNLTTNIETLHNQDQKSLRLINSAILLYYSGSLFIFMFGNHYQQNEDIYLMFWVFNATIALIYYILLTIGIWKTVYQAQKYSM